MDLDIPMSQNITQFQQNGTTNVDHANSSTDSTLDLNEVNNVIPSWENVSHNLSNTQLIYDNPVVSEGVLDDGLAISHGQTMPQNSASVDVIPATNNSPSISATVGLIPNPANSDDNLVINLDDSSSEDSMDSGVTTNQHNELYVGMVFTNRNEFKLHMALYAINKKFRFRNIRSAPNGMVLRCFSSNCQWRVYATKLKDSDVYEIRKLDPIHTCSVDDRSGYQSQVTHHVVGEIMKAHFNGSGGGPKPGEIRQVMQGHIIRLLNRGLSKSGASWQRNDEGYWIFQRKPSDLGYTVLVKPKESFEELETIIRGRYKLKPETPLAMAYHPPEWMLEPDGTRRLPITVSTTS
ncbi:hypothetical protein Bca4012_076493 [Brassica carinata]